MDEKAREVLEQLGEPTIRTVALADVETPELLEVKLGRSRVEYCWTMTPLTPKIVFDRDPDGAARDLCRRRSVLAEVARADLWMSSRVGRRCSSPITPIDPELDVPPSAVSTASVHDARA